MREVNLPVYLKKIRARFGLSQRAMSVILSMSEDNYESIEQGRSKPPQWSKRLLIKELNRWEDCQEGKFKVTTKTYIDSTNEHWIDKATDDEQDFTDVLPEYALHVNVFNTFEEAYNFYRDCLKVETESQS